MNDHSASPPGVPGNGAADETAVTEIELTSDGRIYLFGASPGFLTLLRDCGLVDEFASNRLTELPGLTEDAVVHARNDELR